MLKAIFITGTDTEVGKTVITGLLGWWLKERGYRVITQKWVQTGVVNDVDEHLRIMKVNKEDFSEYIEMMLPYSFKLPASPHLSSEVEGRTIDPARITKSFKYLSKEFEYVLVEGTGGVLVPLSRERLLIDIAKILDLPVLVVAKNRLGAINHTLLTIEALRGREMEIIGVVFNTSSKDENELIIKDNPKIVGAFLGGEMVLGNLGFGEIEDLYDEFRPIGEGIFKRWRSG